MAQYMAQYMDVSSKKFGPCHCCGRRHDARLCKFKASTCHRCGKQGPVCRTASPPPVDKRKKNNKRFYRKRRTGGTKWLEAELEDGDALPLNVLQGNISQQPGYLY